MPATAKTTATATAKLTSALEGFLLVNRLPDPASVTLDPLSAIARIQPDVTAYDDPVAVLSTLLLWSRNLCTPRANWWVSAENRLLITITGRLSSGIRIAVYKSVPYDTVREWVLDNNDEPAGVSLDELAWLVGALHSARPAV